jgi:Zn/Cd-binding protein ZinT
VNHIIKLLQGIKLKINKKKALKLRKKGIAKTFALKYDGRFSFTMAEAERFGAKHTAYEKKHGRDLSYTIKFKYINIRSLKAEISHKALGRSCHQHICNEMGRMAAYYGFNEVWFTFKSELLISYRYRDGVLEHQDLYI